MINFKNFKNTIPYILSLLLVAGMTTAAEISGETEIIFPEITALAVGYMVAEKRSWQVNSKRMLALIAVCAFAGVLTVRYIKIGIYPEIMIAFTLSQIIFMFSGTTFAPLISAIVLPVMLQTTSFVYPIAAVILTAFVIIFRKFIIKTSIRENEKYSPAMLNSKDDVINTIIRIMCVTVMDYAAFYFDTIYIIAPPLLVAFTEFSRSGNKARKKPIKTVLIITACAVIGAGSRYILTILLELPLTIAAVTAAAIMLLVFYCTKTYIPPAGAITVLSMIIPESTILTYPVQILAGSTVIMLLSRILFMKRQNKSHP